MATEMTIKAGYDLELEEAELCEEHYEIEEFKLRKEGKIQN